MRTHLPVRLPGTDHEGRRHQKHLGTVVKAQALIQFREPHVVADGHAQAAHGAVRDAHVLAGLGSLPGQTPRLDLSVPRGQGAPACYLALQVAGAIRNVHVEQVQLAVRGVDFTLRVDDDVRVVHARYVLLDCPDTPRHAPVSVHVGQAEGAQAESGLQRGAVS
eukprot:scaffold6273_cov376-Prasinococcus_capsulatus_cf.AAC.3